MNGGGPQAYHHYRREHWDDDASSSSAYDPSHLSHYGPNASAHHISGPLNGYISDHGSVVSSDDGPTYLLEHLATFTVSHDSGLVYPADGMRRLLHMEKTRGIWTQKMLMKLEKRWVFILSNENRDVVEKFPMELIREPTAFTSEDPKELYNNIFIFVVAEDPKRKYDNPTEMHIFQCLRISAKDVVEDIKVYLSGKSLTGAMKGVGGARKRDHIPPPPHNAVPDSALIANGYREFVDGPVRGGSHSEHSSVSHNDEVSSTSSDRYERNVAILNNCFDDIERFIARLQHTAAATKELERRRKSRKNKKKDIGDGLLSMRAKPPPEREFVDIFQKFKLSFNLLAKLKAHIRDPNAPELVHFLFTPLTLIVDASRDSYYDPPIPPKVLSPLLTQEAIDLLTNCLTSRETELWHSLGDTWLIPLEAWKYPAPPYRPVFYSGWSPEIAEPVMHPTREPKHPKTPGSYHEYADEADGLSPESREVSPGPYMPPYPEKPQQYHPNGNDIWLEELKARGAKIVQVTYPRTANNNKELTVVRGEYLEVIDNSRNWWKARNTRGVVAHVPHTIVTPYSPEDSAHSIDAPSPSRPMKQGDRRFM